MKRANYIGAPEFYHLNNVCRMVTEAFGWHLYLVGSSLKRRDYRDVDIRLILPDNEFDAMFPGISGAHWLDARWSLICASISEWIGKRCNLPIDFQIQRMTEANAEYPDEHPRNALGMFIEQKRG